MTKITKPFAAIFPGQGSQTVGMLKDLAEHHSVIQQSLQEASQHLGIDLWDLVQHGPAERLDQTEFTQPALLATGVAIWRLWHSEAGVKPTVMAGHSLGEYTALVCSEAIDFKDALQLARLRGQLMQGAVQSGEGAMAAIIGLNDQQVEQLCQQVSTTHDRVEPANYNADGQLVVAGHASAIARIVEAAKAAGAKLAKPLNVSVPSHCALMSSITKELSDALMSIEMRMPNIPVLQNVEAASADSVDMLRHMLVGQVHQPVRWTATLRKLAAMNVQLLVEFGPGKVLTGLARRTAPVLGCMPIHDDISFKAATHAARQLS